MAQQIRRFGVGQTAKVLGVLYTLVGLLLVPFFALATMLAPSDEAVPLWLIACLPVLYGLLGLVFTAIGCLVYNAVAGWVGGIEIEVEETV